MTLRDLIRFFTRDRPPAPGALSPVGGYLRHGQSGGRTQLTGNSGEDQMLSYVEARRTYEDTAEALQRLPFPVAEVLRARFQPPLNDLERGELSPAGKLAGVLEWTSVCRGLATKDRTPREVAIVLCAAKDLRFYAALKEAREMLDAALASAIG